MFNPVQSAFETRMSVCMRVFSHVQLFAAPWTIACQAPLCTWNFPGRNTGVGCHFLFQRKLEATISPVDLFTSIQPGQNWTTE